MLNLSDEPVIPSRLLSNMAYFKAKDVVVPDRVGGRIGNELRHGRWYEADMLLHIHHLHIGGYYIDVGANIGNHALYFARNTPAKHVFAVEPSFLGRSICADMIRANGVEERVSILPFAASDRRDIVGFTEVLGRTGLRACVSAAVRLDDVIPSGVGLIKIDVEGAEPDVLRGCTRILAEDGPTLFVEAHDESAIQKIMSTIEPFGYRQSGRVFNASPTFELVR